MSKETYLGETTVDIANSPFKNYTPFDWAMYFIERYGQIDGDHHKAWVIDQVARILKGSPITAKLAKWSTGEEEYRIDIGKQTQEYKKWVREMNKHGYTYEKGIAP